MCHVPAARCMLCRVAADAPALALGRLLVQLCAGRRGSAGEVDAALSTLVGSSSTGQHLLRQLPTSYLVV